MRNNASSFVRSPNCIIVAVAGDELAGGLSRINPVRSRAQMSGFFGSVDKYTSVAFAVQNGRNVLVC